MTIYLYNITDDPNTISKTLPTGTTFTGSIRGSGAVDVVRPEIEIAANVYGYNYAYISDFGRYYYIREITQDRRGLSVVSLVSDPLMSFKTDILAMSAIAARVTGDDDTLFNSFLPDDRMRINASDYVGHYELHEFGWGNQYILITAG